MLCVVEISSEIFVPDHVQLSRAKANAYTSWSSAVFDKRVLGHTHKVWKFQKR